MNELKYRSQSHGFGNMSVLMNRIPMATLAELARMKRSLEGVQIVDGIGLVEIR